MASTYSPNLRLELIGTGEQQGTWGATTNTNLGTLIEEAIGGYVSVTVSDAGDTTLTTNNGSADQARNAVINLTGTISQARNVLCPAIEKVYIVRNATTGGFAVTFKVSGQTGVSIPNGSTYLVYVNGTDAVAVTASMASQSANNVSISGGSISNATLSNVAVVANASSLSVRDSDGSNVLSIAVGSNLTANTVLTLTTGGTTNRTLDISASNVTISTAGANLIDDADASAQRTTLGLGTIATQNENNVSITGGAISGLSNLSVANVTVAATVRTNLGLGTGDSPQFTAIEIGNASDTTVSRSAAGVVAVEGNLVPSPSSQAHGDVLYRGASSWERLAAGTSGQFLRTAGAGAAPTWASAGGWTTIGTYTPSNAASVAITGLSSYRLLRATLINFRPATDGQSLDIEVSTDNGSTYTDEISSNGGAMLGAEMADGGTITGIGADTLSNQRFGIPEASESVGNLVADGMLHATFLFSNFNKAAYKSAFVTAIFGDGGAREVYQAYNYLFETTNIYNAIRFSFDSGNIAEGVLILEGFEG
jgi:hypothetical protein